MKHFNLGLAAFALLIIPGVVSATGYSSDRTPPVISSHSNVTVTATTNAGAKVTYTLPTAKDAKDGTVSVSCTPSSGSQFPIGNTTVTCSAKDRSGNEARSSFKVTVNPLPPDRTPPTIASHPKIVVDATSSAGAFIDYALPTANDARDGVVPVSCSPLSGTTFSIGVTTVRCSAHDAAGNTSSSSFTVTVKPVPPPPPDRTAPKPLSIHIQSNNTNPSQAKAGDTVTISFTASEKVNPVVLVESRVLFAKSVNTGGNSWDASYVVTSKDRTGNKVDYLLTLRDTAGNIYACSSARLPLVGYCPTTDGSSVTIYKQTTPPADTTAPVIAAHADVTVTATDSSGATVTYSLPTANDAKDGAVPVLCAPASGTLFAIGNTTVTCTAADIAGNAASTTFSVIVNPLPPDTTPPVINSSTNIAVDADDENGASVAYVVPNATDARDGAVAVSCTPPTGSVFAIGTTPVNCSATDAAGNTSSSSFTVTVNPLPDRMAPTLESHDDITVETSDGAGASVTYTAPSATDNIDPNPTVECAPASGTLFELGDTEVECVAEDATGNTSSTTSFKVTVVFVPQPYTMASQEDESNFCNPDWRECYTGGTPESVINLGQGSNFGNGSLLSLTIARDDSYGPVLEDYPWTIEIRCYTNSAYTSACPDWTAPNAWNGDRAYFVREAATSTQDLKYWTAYFTDPSHETNFDGSAPVVFNPAYYYRLSINDNNIIIGAYGSATEPYWVMTGMTRP
ncbi:MAG TPA: HYR domain-containing protein [Candidatus Paceibacterota bacterium]|nr:HYR domain-containing protein [Candidatus Paceibacterota bacterium]